MNFYESVFFMAQSYEPVIIGIDGGGSRTRGIMYRGENVIAQMETGTARVGTVGVVESAERLLNLISDLIKMAHLPKRELDAVCIGLAGTWLKEEQLRSQQLLDTLARRERNIDIDRLLVVSDAAIALEAALEGANGIVMIVGTGTIAIGKRDDEFVRCGGWGIELSDEGSGAWIGREGLRALVRHFDGRGKPTALAEIMLAKYPTIKPEQPRTLVTAFNERAFDYQAVTPLVMQCALEGDEVCKEIIERSCRHLLEMVDTIYQRYFKDVKKLPIACVGGIMEADTMLAQMVTDGLNKHAHLKVQKPKGLPLEGAVRLARGLLAADQKKEL
jgi:N-acetylglucosamine kinase-like BadF-type ATPase